MSVPDTRTAYLLTGQISEHIKNCSAPNTIRYAESESLALR